MGYRIDWAGGLWEPADSYEEAVGIVQDTYPGSVVDHAHDLGHDGARTLAWRTEDDAEESDGCRLAVATIRPVH